MCCSCDPTRSCRGSLSTDSGYLQTSFHYLLFSDEMIFSNPTSLVSNSRPEGPSDSSPPEGGLYRPTHSLVVDLPLRTVDHLSFLGCRSWVGPVRCPSSLVGVPGADGSPPHRPSSLSGTLNCSGTRVHSKGGFGRSLRPPLKCLGCRLFLSTPFFGTLVPYPRREILLLGLSTALPTFTLNHDNTTIDRTRNPSLCGRLG